MSAADTIRAAERALVGAILTNPADAIRQAVEEVTEDDFANPHLGAVYATACTMYAEGVAIDPILVDDRLRKDGIKGIHGADLFGLIERVGTTSNAGHYARIVAEGALRRRLARTAARIGQLAESEEDISAVMGHARDEWATVATRAGRRLAAKTLGEVLDGPDEYDWLIPNLIERHDRLILTGSEGAGKTMLIRQMAVLAAAGLHPTTFRSIDPIRVLVVDAENTERQWRRTVRPMVAKARNAGHRDPAEALHIVAVDEMPGGRLDLTSERDLGTVHRLVDEHTPDLLVIGPLYKLVPRAINSDDDAAPLINALDGLRGRGLALVMEAHAGHASNGSGERDLRPRGSAALMGWPEFGLGLRVDREALAGMPPGTKPSVFQLVRWRGDRDERAWPDRIRRGGDWPWTDDRMEPGWTTARTA